MYFKQKEAPRRLPFTLPFPRGPGRSLQAEIYKKLEEKNVNKRTLNEKKHPDVSPSHYLFQEVQGEASKPKSTKNKKKNIN
jgi:hypothetical protein